jgi:hypothetical protein
VTIYNSNNNNTIPNHSRRVGALCKQKYLHRKNEWGKQRILILFSRGFPHHPTVWCIHVYIREPVSVCLENNIHSKVYSVVLKRKRNEEATHEKKKFSARLHVALTIGGGSENNKAPIQASISKTHLWRMFAGMHFVTSPSHSLDCDTNTLTWRHLHEDRVRNCVRVCVWLEKQNKTHWIYIQHEKQRKNEHFFGVPHHYSHRKRHFCIFHEMKPF